MNFIKFTSIFAIFCIAFTNGRILNEQYFDAFQQTNKGIYEYLHTGKQPDYLKSAVKQFNLYHLFRSDEPHNFDDNAVCTICNTAVDGIIALRRLGATRDELAVAAETLCSLLQIEDAEVCNGVVELNIDIIMHLIDKNLEITGQKICSLILQGQNCDKGDNYEWEMQIPEGYSVNRKEPDPSETFNIIQISDFHYDPMYGPGKDAACTQPLCCQSDHPDPESPENTCGYWTEYQNADTPWHLVLETFRHINTQKFDYIYFTGDIISHRVWSTSITNNSRDLRQMFQQFRDSFSVPIYPIFGNHEPHPLNVWTPDNEDDGTFPVHWLYDLAAEEWAEWLPEDALTTVAKGGYYTVSPRPGFRVVVLNSNVCYNFNWWLFDQDFDPYGQLQWLIEVLTEAEKNDESVHVLSHIPTGSGSCLATWGREYRKIINRFGNTVTAQFNGHTHKDEFVVFYNRSEPTQPLNVAFNGASVTPYSNSNPSYKVYEIDTKAFNVLDYTEWTFNLTSENLNPSTEVSWYNLYSFKDAYGMNSLEPVEFENLLTRMAQDHSLLDLYFRFKVRNGDTDLANGCDMDCQRSNLCGLAVSEFGDRTQCDRFLQLYDDNLRN